MKKTLILVSALAALSTMALAQESTTTSAPAVAKAPAKKADEKPVRIEKNLSGPAVTTTTTPAGTGTVQESPLAQAVKKVGKLKKKPGQVITNETIRQKNGDVHISTSNSTNKTTTPVASAPAENAPAPDPAKIQAEKDAAAKAEADAKEKVHQEKVANISEEAGALYADPAASESERAKTAGQSSASNTTSYGAAPTDRPAETARPADTPRPDETPRPAATDRPAETPKAKQ